MKVPSLKTHGHNIHRGIRRMGKIVHTSGTGLLKSYLILFPKEVLEKLAARRVLVSDVIFPEESYSGTQLSTDSRSSSSVVSTRNIFFSISDSCSCHLRRLRHELLEGVIHMLLMQPWENSLLVEAALLEIFRGSIPGRRFI